MWYEGTSRRYTSPGTKVKVICKGQGQILRSCFSKDRCFGSISVSQTHLVFSENAFNMNQTKNLFFCKNVNTDTITSGQSKLKPFCNLQMKNETKILNLAFYGLENIAGKRENADYQHFILFLYFRKHFLTGL